MGYFEGLASGIIKKDKDGNGVYYPWGVMGKGYVLPDAARETEIKNMVIMFYKLFFGLFILYIIFKQVAIFGLATIALVIWFLYKSKQLTNDCPKSDEKLTLKEGYTNSAKAHNKWVLRILFTISIIFTLLGYVVLMTGSAVFGVLIMALFSASTVAIGYMLKIKSETIN